MKRRCFVILSFFYFYIVAMLMVAMPVTGSAQGLPYLRNYKAADYGAHNQNFDVFAANDGMVFVANFEGLLYYDSSRWRIIHTQGVTRITSVFQDSKGVVWTGGYNYFGSLLPDDNGVLRMVPHESKHPFRGEVQWIWEKMGKIYFLASDRKVYVEHNGSYMWVAGEQSPTSNLKKYNVDVVINQVESLDNGLEALATNGDGVVFVDRNGNELFRMTEQNGLCSNSVTHMDYNHHGLLWGATDNGIFCICFPSIYTHFTSHEGLFGEVLSIESLNNHLYAATLKGVFRQEGKTFHQVPQVTHACWQLVLQGNKLLAATSDGVWSIDEQGRAARQSNHSTMSLMADDTKGYYSGEMDGVYYNADGKRQQVSDVEKVVAIKRDKDGMLWLQNLYGGIWKGDGKNTFTPYADGSEQDVMTLVDFGSQLVPIATHATKPISYPLFSFRDSQGMLWLTDNKGKHLYAYQNGAVDEKFSSYVYPLMDSPVRAMMHDSLLMMGGDNGINVINYQRKDPLKDLQPLLRIRSVLLNGDSLLWGGCGKQPDVLPELSSQDRNIKFFFSIDYPSLLLDAQYRTRLDDGKWAAWDSSVSEEYTSLSYGSHTFEVQARDAFGRQSAIVSMQFHIPAPFYLRWYMNVVYLIMLGLIVYVFMKLRMRKLQRDKRHLEALVSERTNQVVRLEKQASVGKLTQGLIDRILNPMNYINNFAKLSEGLVKDVKANVEDEKEHMDPDNYEDTLDVLDMLKGNLEKVGEHGANTTRTLKAMEEMLKDHTGGIVPMSLTALLRQDQEMLQKYFEKDIAQYGIGLSFDIPEDDIQIKGNAEQLHKTMMSILNNAVYAVVKKKQRDPSSQPEIRLNMSIRNDTAEIRIRDNGTGIEKTIVNKIFDPFFTTKTTGEAAGVGLYLSREIIQNYGGDITVESEKNVYTEFTITIPVLKL